MSSFGARRGRQGEGPRIGGLRFWACGLGLDMRVYWQCIWWFMGLFQLLVLPFSIFYYESDTDPRLSKTLNPKPFRKALCLTVGSVFAVAAVIGVCFLFFRSVHLKLNQDFCYQVNPASNSNPQATGTCNRAPQTAAETSYPHECYVWYRSTDVATDVLRLTKSHP